MTREIFAQSKIEIKNINLKKKYLYPVVSCALEYKFLGHRQYTHGSSMFEGMLKTIFRFEKKCKSKIIEFKVVKQFNQFSYTEAFEEKYLSFHPNVKKAVAVLVVRLNKKKYVCLLFKKKDKIKQRLNNYRSQNYIKKIDTYKNKSKAYFKNIQDYIDLIRAINEGNRQITLAEMPNDRWKKKIRWAYIQNLEVIKDNFCRQYKSVIYNIEKDIQLGKKRFVIKKGKLISKNRIINFKICFFIQIP